MIKGAGQFDGPKNYEYFGGLVKKKVYIYLIDVSFCVESNIKKKRSLENFKLF